MKIQTEICDALEGKHKNLIQKNKGNDNYTCICPYCKESMGVINDPGYYFDRVNSPNCPDCGAEFEVEDKVRKKNGK
jgi:transposase-like protein